MNYYNYVREVDQDSFAYNFLTSGDLAYTVVISPNIYDGFFTHSPMLQEHSWGMVFFYHPFREPHDSSNDPRVSETIAKIVEDFLKEFPHNVLIYHCDSSDDRQQVRQELFNQWVEKYSGTSKIIHDTITFVEASPSGDKEHYFGFFAFNDHSNIEEIKDDFIMFFLEYISSLEPTSEN